MTRKYNREMVERAEDTEERMEAEIDGPEEVEDDEIQLSWQRLFLLVTAISYEDGVDIKDVTSEGPLEINGDDTYGIKVNPVIQDPFGNLEILALNLYHDGTHVQQVIAKAKWENGTPSITDIDNDPMDDPRQTLGLAQIASYAEDHLRQMQNEMSTPTFFDASFFPIPEVYTNTIH